jgi:hypothetical protein
LDHLRIVTAIDDAGSCRALHSNWPWIGPRSCDGSRRWSRCSVRACSTGTKPSVCRHSSSG